MSLSVNLSPDHGYVLLAGAGMMGTLMWQTILVGKARKRAGIAYPQVYAEKAEVENNTGAKIFNCTQRAHHQTLESLPMTLLGLVANGFQYPKTTSSLTLIWILGRIAYTLGYTTGDPVKRNRGGFGYIGTIGLMGLTIYSGVSMVLKKF